MSCPTGSHRLQRPGNERETPSAMPRRAESVAVFNRDNRQPLGRTKFRFFVAVIVSQPEGVVNRDCRAGCQVSQTSYFPFSERNVSKSLRYTRRQPCNSRLGNCGWGGSGPELLYFFLGETGGSWYDLRRRSARFISIVNRRAASAEFPRSSIRVFLLPKGRLVKIKWIDGLSGWIGGRERRRKDDEIQTSRNIGRGHYNYSCLCRGGPC